MQTLLAIDISGSTGGSEFYWSQVEQIYRQQTGDILILLWDDRIDLATKKDLKTLFQTRSGRGGTTPHVVAEFIRNNRFTGRLVLVTDGEVNQGSVDRIDSILDNSKLDSVECHIINLNGGNLSVTCPFTRRGYTRVWTYNREGSQLALSTDPATFLALDTINEIKTLEEFNLNVEKIRTAIVARNMGASGLPEIRANLLELRKRLNQEWSKRNKFDGEKLLHLTRKTASEMDMEEALKTFADMEESYYGEEPEWTLQLNQLIELCGDMRGRFTISSRFERAKLVREEKVEELPTTDGSKVECPIMLDTDTPFIMIKAGEPLLLDCDKKTVEYLTNNPLNLLNNKQLCEKVKQRIDTVVGLEAMKEGNFAISPLTREKIMGGLVLGKDKSHARYTDYSLAQLFTGGKLLGNIDLWYAAVQLIIMDIPRLEEIKSSLQEHLVWRFEHRTTYAALCGDNKFCLTRIPLGASLWYIVHRPLVKSVDAKDLASVRDDVQRFHLGCLHTMLRLVTEHYSVKSQAINHIQRLRTLNYLLVRRKNDSNLSNLMRALYQKCLMIRQPDKDLVTVLLDGPSSEKQIEEVLGCVPPDIRQLGREELYGLYLLADPSKSLGDIPLLIDWTPSALPSAVNEWGYGPDALVSYDVPICPQTMRPYYQPKTEVWKTVAQEVWRKPVKQLFSGNECYVQCVQKLKVFPTREQYIIYCWERYTHSLALPRTTLPEAMEIFSLDVYNSYVKALAINPLTVEQFITLTKRSQDSKLRMELEKTSL